MTLLPLTTTNTVSTTCGFTFELAADRERVWRAITQETRAWWPKHLLAGGAASKLSLEARIGGRLFEEWGAGAGLVWYTVIAIDPGVSLDLFGHVTPRFGGPALTQLHIELSDVEGGTRIGIADGVFGRDRTDTSRRVTEGWSLLFGNNLKRHIEGR